MSLISRAIISTASGSDKILQDRVSSENGGDLLTAFGTILSTRIPLPSTHVTGNNLDFVYQVNLLKLHPYRLKGSNITLVVDVALTRLDLNKLISISLRSTIFGSTTDRGAGINLRDGVFRTSVSINAISTPSKVINTRNPHRTGYWGSKMIISLSNDKLMLRVPTIDPVTYEYSGFIEDSIDITSNIGSQWPTGQGSMQLSSDEEKIFTDLKIYNHIFTDLEADYMFLNPIVDLDFTKMHVDDGFKIIPNNVENEIEVRDIGGRWPVVSKNPTEVNPAHRKSLLFNRSSIGVPPMFHFSGESISLLGPITFVFTIKPAPVNTEVEYTIFKSPTYTITIDRDDKLNFIGHTSSGDAYRLISNVIPNLRTKFSTLFITKDYIKANRGFILHIYIDGVHFQTMESASNPVVNYGDINPLDISVLSTSGAYVGHLINFKMFKVFTTDENIIKRLTFGTCALDTGGNLHV